MLKNARRQRGFTLIELLVSSVIVTILSMTAWYSQATLIQANEITRNSIMAVNLQRLSQEEVRRVAYTTGNYANLGNSTCNFQVGNTCGFQDITTTFPGFQRTLTVSNIIPGNNTFNTVTIDVTWNEPGRPRSLTSVTYLSQPPSALPGNLIGLIKDSTTGNNLAGVSIVASQITSPGTLPAFSQAVNLPALQANYTFANLAGQFQMEPGAWNITATKSGYKNFTSSAPVMIFSNRQAVFDFSMTPEPAKGIVTVAWPTGQPYTPKGTVGIYQNGQIVQQSSANFTGSYTFTLGFTDPQKQCFTVATFQDMYKNGFVGNFSCAPSPMSQEPRGWSSAVVLQDGSRVCGNPWTGNALSDRICIDPGQTLVLPIPVVPVATTTVSGVVRDQNNKPISGAVLTIRWHDNGNYPWPGKPATVVTNASGAYTATVPALQSLLPNIVTNHLRMTASANVPITRCCGVASTVAANSAMARVGPLYAGIPAVKDFVVNTTSQVQACGGANGNVKDGSTFGGVGSAAVVLSSTINTTSDGNYQYQCPDSSPLSVPAASYTQTVSKANYYSFTTQGNSYYAKVGTGTLAVAANVSTPLPQVNLWPRGYGNMNVSVILAGTAIVIPGATVSLTGPSSATVITNTSGRAVFNNIPETWPPAQVVGNVYYNQTVKDYAITVTHQDYETATVPAEKVIKGQTATRTIALTPKGGM